MFYEGNAIYRKLAEEKSARLVAPGSNAWPLIYGSGSGQPLALVLACRVEASSGRPLVRDGFPLLAYRLACAAGLPFRFMGFVEADPARGFLVKNSPQEATRLLSSARWKAELAALGIGGPGTAGKAINRASSSGYHGWQRQHLGNITAVDIDLVRMDPQGNPCQVIELKRSSIPMEKWAPFADDAKNFDLMGAFCKKAGVDFLLAFNEYCRSTLKDDLSRLKVFEYMSPGFSELGQQSWEDWEKWDRPVITPPASRSFKPGR